MALVTSWSPWGSSLPSPRWLGDSRGPVPRVGDPARWPCQLTGRVTWAPRTSPLSHSHIPAALWPSLFGLAGHQLPAAASSGLRLAGCSHPRPSPLQDLLRPGVQPSPAEPRPILPRPKGSQQPGSQSKALEAWASSPDVPDPSGPLSPGP